MYKIMFSAGEASGDLHGASVALALKELNADIRIFGMGGQAMQAAGVEIIYDIAELGVIGVAEVIRNLPRLFKVRSLLAEAMEREKPDVLVVIDYAGFNMKLAKIAKAKNIPVVYYISPKFWAWGRWRAKQMINVIERVATIFPFETDLYREIGVNATFVGHPLIDIVKPAMTKEEAYQYFNAQPEKPIVLLMPGSRQQEIVNLLPVMLAAGEKIADKVPDCQFFLPIASTISREMLEAILNKHQVKVNLTTGHVYDLMNIATAAVAASGTVTLEAAVMNLPTVIIYKVAGLTWALGKMLVKIPYVGLPNIVAGRRILPELLQHEVRPECIAGEIISMLTDGNRKRALARDLAEVRQKLGGAGAVQRVAHTIMEVAQEQFGGQK
ncbi:MAG: lipid-A-disaccharide synthase [Pelosinus sp.]|nr:lipid-A-disaccharide synthase [Pelosinus sp.]